VENRYTILHAFSQLSQQELLSIVDFDKLARFRRQKLRHSSSKSCKNWDWIRPRVLDHAKGVEARRFNQIDVQVSPQGYKYHIKEKVGNMYIHRPPEFGILGVGLEVRAFVPTFACDITVLVVIADDAIRLILENLHQRKSSLKKKT